VCLVLSADSSPSALTLVMSPVCLCILDKYKHETLHSTLETGIGAWGSNDGRGLQGPQARVRGAKKHETENPRDKPPKLIV
jgi:hypothetical protein